MPKLRPLTLPPFCSPLLGLLTLALPLITPLQAFAQPAECPSGQKKRIKDETSIEDRYKPTQDFDQLDFGTCYGFAATYMLEYLYNQQNKSEKPVGLSPLSVLGNSCNRNIKKAVNGGFPYSVLYRLQENRENQISTSKDMPYHIIMPRLSPLDGHWIDPGCKKSAVGVLSSINENIISSTIDIASYAAAISKRPDTFHFDLIDHLAHEKITIPPYNVHVLEVSDNLAATAEVKDHFKKIPITPLNMNDKDHAVVITGARTVCCGSICHDEWNIANSWGKGIEDGWSDASGFSARYFSYLTSCGNSPKQPCKQEILGKYPACYMARSASVSNFEKFINNHPESLNDKDNNGSTPAHIAAYEGRLDIIEFLAKNYPESLNAKDNSGQTYAHLAAYGGKLDIIEFLAKNYPKSLNAKDNYGQTPAHLAAYEGKLDIIEFLAKNHRESLNIKDINGQTPVHLAAYGGKLDIIEFLAKNYPKSLNAKDNDGRTSAHLAAYGGKLDIIEFLAKNYRESLNAKDNYGQTPAHIAAYEGKLDIIEFLTKNYPESLNAKDNDGETPAELLRSKGKMQD